MKKNTKSNYTRFYRRAMVIAQMYENGELSYWDYEWFMRDLFRSRRAYHVGVSFAEYVVWGCFSVCPYV